MIADNDAHASARLSASTEAKILEELVHIQYRQSSQTLLFASFLGVGLPALVFWHRVPGYSLLAWVAVSWTVTAAHMWINRYYLRHRPRLDVIRWGWIFTAFMGLDGACWGSVGVLFFQPDDVLVIALVCIMLAGGASTYVAVLSAFQPAYYAYAVPALLPFALRAFWHGDLLFTVLGALALVCLAMSLIASRNAHRSLRQSVSLRFDNLELIEQLTREKERAETLRERAETLRERAEALWERAETLNGARTRFLAAASHDLRQPLHSMTMLFLALQGHIHHSDSDGQKILGNINLSLEALQELFAALLDISRLDADVIRPEVRHFHLHEIFQRLRNDYEPEAEEKGLTFHCVDTDLTLYSDPQLLERILRNFLSNAIRYTKQGSVSLRVEAKDGVARIAVEDTGVGIPHDKQREIFQEFLQLQNPERDRTQGLGLGLAIVERLARLLEHAVEVDSEPGRGSVFSIRVPVGDALAITNPPAIDHRHDPDAADLSGLLILVIDDEYNVRYSMATLLGEWNCECLLAGSEDEAIEQLRATERAPDAVIADYRLRAERTGVQAIGRIHQEYGETIPALIITGDTAPDRLREALASGYRLLHKPVPMAELRRFLSDVKYSKATVEAGPPNEPATT